MKNNNPSFLSGRQGFVSCAFPAIISLVLSAGTAMADNGTWTSTADGLWSEPTNWAPGPIADGSGFGADFSTIDPTVNILVSLDSPRTLSSLVFGDTDTATPAGWLVNNNADSLNILTLDGSATVTVNALGTDAVAEISAAIAGTAGITKEGPGTLLLSGTSTYTGPTNVNGGTLIQRNFASVNSSHAIASGATLEFADSSNINMAGGTITGSGTLVKSGAGNLGLGFSNYVPVNVNLDPGSLIHVVQGTLSGSSYGQGQWAYNHSDLLLETGATFNSSEKNAQFDSVNGSGDLKGGYWGTPATITVGVDGGSGTLTGTLNESDPYLDVPLGLTKEGAGTQTFSGPVNHYGTTTVNGGVLSFPSFSESPLYTIATDTTLEINCAVNQSRNIKNVLINGGGDFVKKGTGLLMVNRYQGEADRSYEIALAGTSEIRIEAGELRLGDYNISWNTANNLADLHIETGATLNALGTNMTVDALTGGGIFKSGQYGDKTLTIGINGGSGTFSGTIQGNSGSDRTRLIKRGNGTQICTGSIINTRAVEVRSGTTISPSTLVLSPTDPLSTIGDGSIYISPGSADVSVLEQTAGTFAGSLIAVGEYGQGTFNFSGGTVNAGRVEFAWNGGGNGGPAVMNISGSAAMNILSNGNILMGQYYGRGITVNQTGGSVVQFSDAGVTRGGTGKMRFFSGNQNVTWNLSAGTLSIAGMERGSGGGYGGGNGILNLNGGILQITNPAFAAPTGIANGKPVLAAKVLGDDLTPNSGARFDNYGLGVTFAAPIQHGTTVSPFDGGLSLETSVPGGSLTLAGVNTYTGDTTVAADNTLVLADNAELAFRVDGTDATQLTGAGAATLAGDFRIDTTNADTTPGTEWTLVDVATRTFVPETFQVLGFSKSGDVWSKIAYPNQWTFTESSGKLAVAVAPPGYETWIAKPEFALALADQDPADDPDNDGAENLLEYVLNGNPSLSDPDILPDVDNTTEPANLVFTFTRREESANDTTQVFEYGTNLTGWTPVNITGTPGSEVTIDTAVDGLQLITVRIPKTAAGAEGKLFGRLEVTKP